MIVKKPRLYHLLPVCIGAVLAALPIVLMSSPVAADAYDDLPPYTNSGEAAVQLDPNDPVADIDAWWRCRTYNICARRPVRRGPPHPPMMQPMPGMLGHATFLVDCGRPRGSHHRGPHSPEAAGYFSSVDEAAAVAPPYATILILPPGQGMTCVETVHVRRPLTIASYGGAGQAVIQAPAGAPCLVAEIPLGDGLTIDGVKFISRSREEPCVDVEAGRVSMRNSQVDSRGSNWAFEVRESGELTLESSRIETDTSGVHARRASVTLRNVEIAIDGRRGTPVLTLGRTDCIDRTGGTVHGSVGLALECSEGLVENTHIIGGAVGLLASAGTRGLRLSEIKLTKPDTGILLLPGQLGTVTVEKALISKARDGIVVAPGAESQITGSVITDTSAAGITAFGTETLISSNKIVNAEDGIRILAAEAFPPPFLPQFEAIPVIDGHGGGPVVENNLIANARRAGVRVDARGPGGGQHPLFGKLMGNTIYARSPAVCIDDAYNDDPVRVRANSCNREWLPWPF